MADIWDEMFGEDFASGEETDQADTTDPSVEEEPSAGLEEDPPGDQEHQEGEEKSKEDVEGTEKPSEEQKEEPKEGPKDENLAERIRFLRQEEKRLQEEHTSKLSELESKEKDLLARESALEGAVELQNWLDNIDKSGDREVLLDFVSDRLGVSANDLQDRGKSPKQGLTEEQVREQVRKELEEKEAKQAEEAAKAAEKAEAEAAVQAWRDEFVKKQDEFSLTKAAGAAPVAMALAGAYMSANPDIHLSPADALGEFEGFLQKAVDSWVDSDAGKARIAALSAPAEPSETTKTITNEDSGSHAKKKVPEDPWEREFGDAFSRAETY
jgi:hypothetical protein